MSLISRIRSFFTRIFTPELLTNAYIAVLVTNNLKNLIDSPKVDILTAIIPGTFDDLLVQKLRMIIPRVAWNVAYAHRVITGNTAQSVALKQLFNCLRELTKSNRALYWIDFAAKLYASMSNHPISDEASRTETQIEYEKSFKHR